MDRHIKGETSWDFITRIHRIPGWRWGQVEYRRRRKD